MLVGTPGRVTASRNDAVDPPRAPLGSLLLKAALNCIGLFSVSTTYLDLTTGEEQVFRRGDFYVIEPGIVYAQKSAPGTEILFIKVPPGNDKVPVDTTPEVEA
jgi:hypothetical protein